MPPGTARFSDGFPDDGSGDLWMPFSGLDNRVRGGRFSMRRWSDGQSAATSAPVSAIPAETFHDVDIFFLPDGGTARMTALEGKLAQERHIPHGGVSRMWW